MARRITRNVDADNGVITFTVEGKEPLIVSLKQVEAMLRRLALHGLSQKVGDSAAGAESADEAYESMEATIKDLLAGRWTTRVAGTGGAGRTSYLVRAIAEYKGLTGPDGLAAAKAAVEALEEQGEAGEAKIKEIKKALKPIITRLQAEDALKKAEAARSESGGEIQINI